MTWLSLLIGVLIGWIAEWIIDVFYWRRRSGAGSTPRGGQTAAQPEADRRAIELRAEAESRRLQQESQATEIAGLRAQLAAQDDLERRLAECQGEVESVRAQLEGAYSERAAVRAAPATDLPVPPPAAMAAELAPAEPAAAALGAVAGEPAATSAAEDNLEIIEGIGPKIADLLRENGIQTFAGLAAAEVSALQAILTAAGPRYRMANPATWPAQADLAAAGEWDALHALQARLTAGLEEKRP